MHRDEINSLIHSGSFVIHTLKPIERSTQTNLHALSQAAEALHNARPASPRLHVYRLDTTPERPSTHQSEADHPIIPSDPYPQQQSTTKQVSDQNTRLVRQTRYKIVEPLGTGIQGTVYKVINPFPEKWPGKFLALKQFNPTPGQLHRQRYDYTLEKNALMDMDASIFRDKQRLLDYDDAKMTLIIPFIAGQTLKDVMKHAKHSEEYMAYKPAYDLLAGLFKRRFGRIHGDIRPLNVIVKPTGDLELIDFGMSLPLSLVPNPTFDAVKGQREWDLALLHIRAAQADNDMVNNEWTPDVLYRIKEFYDAMVSRPGMVERAQDMREGLLRGTGLDLGKMEIVNGQLVFL